MGSAYDSFRCSSVSLQSTILGNSNFLANHYSTQEEDFLNDKGDPISKFWPEIQMYTMEKNLHVLFFEQAQL